jgi:hypothetical protein
MISKFSGKCQHCAANYEILEMDGQFHGKCLECEGQPLKNKKFKGLIYILSNPHNEGVKIGFTTNSLDTRVKQLRSAGVNGVLKKIAFWPSDNPNKLEKKVHGKLERFWIKESFGKEFYKLGPIEACVKVKNIVKKPPIFIRSEDEEAYLLVLKRNRIEMELRLNGKKISK